MANKKRPPYVDNHLLELCRHPILSKEEELDLIERYQRDGDVEARNELLRCNQRLVVLLVRKCVPAALIERIGIMDLVAEGNLGLMLAIDKFETSLGNRLSTYASWWIRTFVQRFSDMQRSIVKVPIRAGEKRRKLIRDEGRRAADEGREFHVGELTFDQAALTWALVRPIDVHGEYRGAGGELLPTADVISDGVELVDEHIIREAYMKKVKVRWLQIRPHFAPREQAIIENRLMVDEDQMMTLADLGKQMGLSRERVRQIEAKIKLRLRAMFEDFSDCS